MTRFHRSLVEIDRRLTMLPPTTVRERALAQAGSFSPEEFLLDGYALSDGRRRLVWDWGEEELALLSVVAGRRALAQTATPRELAESLEREIRLALAAFLIPGTGPMTRR